MHLRLEHLTDEELHYLAELYNDLASDGHSRGLQELAGDLADVFKVEQARRRISAAWERDPLGMGWFGRL
jgi:hypothetical protein